MSKKKRFILTRKKNYKIKLRRIQKKKLANQFSLELIGQDDRRHERRWRPNVTTDAIGNDDDDDNDDDDASDEFQVTFFVLLCFAFWKKSFPKRSYDLVAALCPTLFRIHWAKCEQRLAYQGEAQLNETGWWSLKTSGGGSQKSTLAENSNEICDGG